jgi:acyl-CoA synthetase (AMP-forming)/AMP-acid ligase II
LRTGDVDHPEEGGFVYITGRIKEVIIRSSENVAAPAAPDCPRTPTGATRAPRSHLDM